MPTGLRRRAWSWLAGLHVGGQDEERGLAFLPFGVVHHVAHREGAMLAGEGGAALAVLVALTRKIGLPLSGSWRW